MSIINGTSGADYLRGTETADTLKGDVGNDTLQGSWGNDTYLFARGDGVDTITEYDPADGNIDTVQFVDVKSTDVLTVEHKGSDLVISYGSSDKIIIEYYFNYYFYQIEQIKFSDGVTWDTAAIMAHGTAPGTTGNDYLTGFSGKANLIQGLAGDDNLASGDGNDTLEGGTGNDTLYGGGGDDIYVFARGDGMDSINDFGLGRTDSDTVRFQDVKSTDLLVEERKGDDLIISYGSGDQIKLKDYFTGSGAQIRQIQFSDGVTWDSAAIVSHITAAGTAGADALYGLNGKPNLLSGLAGNDSLTGSDGNDTLNGGVGNDMMNGGVGNDTYVFARGDGVDTITEFDNSAGNLDTLQFVDVKSTELRAVERLGDNLLVSYGIADQLIIQNYFAGTQFQIESVQFSDGVTADGKTINARYTAANGTAGDDRLFGIKDRPNQIFGLAGNDYLGGGEGNDTLNGGTGNDNMQGGWGNDTYVLARGDGVDTINTFKNSGDLDTVQFVDVKSTELRSLEGKGYDLLINYGSSDQLIIQSFFIGGDLLQIKFSDGVILDAAAIKSNLTIRGTAGNDNLSVFEGSTSPVFGLAGDDTLIGNFGNDTLDGGTGNDKLDGVWGNDYYLFQRGDGVDKIFAGYPGTGSLRTVEFRDVSSTELRSVERNARHLVINYGSSDQIIVEDYVGGYSQTQIKFSDGVIWNNAAIIAHGSTHATTSDDALYGFDGVSSQIPGLAGNDSLTGGDNGNDTLNGGTGNDTLTGGTGADTYVFAKGDGVDSVNDIFNPAYKNTVQFADVKSTELSAVERKGTDLHISYGVADHITLYNFFYNTAQGPVVVQPEQIKFSDGVAWDSVTLRSHVITNGTSGNEYIYGYSDGPNQLFGLAGNDYLFGSGYDDRLEGGDGDDGLSGAAGNDTLIGGAGNDNMYGDSGNDTYVFSRGDGSDTLYDSDAPANIDTAQFLDVASTELRAVERSSYDLVLKYGSTDQLVIQGYFAGPSYRIEQIKFSDGVTWNIDDVSSRVPLFNGTAASDILYGLNGKPNQLAGLAGNDSIVGGNSNDTLDGGVGNDTIQGDAGDDLIDGGAGFDTVRFNGNRSDYVITLKISALQVQDKVGTDGIDVLTNIERAFFQDGLRAFDVTGKVGNVIHTLGAVFGADSVKNPAYVGTGLYYADLGMSYEQLMDFAISIKLGSNASHGQVVDLLYSNLFGSLPDASSKAYYVSLLDTGTMSVAQLGLMAANSSYNENNIGLTGLMQTGVDYNYF